MLLLLLSWSVLASPSARAEDPASYSFLLRQGALLLEYRRHAEATEVLIRACALPEGARSAECLGQLAQAAEGARRVGVAIAAWERSAILPGPGAEVARAELDRLRSTWGSIRWSAAADRRWPSRSLALSRTDPLLDPAIKVHAAAIVEQVGRVGLDGGLLWLPAGSWKIEGRPLLVEAGRENHVAALAAWLPWFPVAFRLPGAAEPRSLAGPWTLHASWELSWSRVAGGAVGQHPISMAARIAAGRQLGPLRVELGARVGSGAVQSGKGDPEREDPRLLVLGDADLGILLQLGRVAWMVPHVSFVAGTLGDSLLPCVVQGAGAWLWSGECRLPTQAVGGQGGVDVMLAPAPTEALALRIGLTLGGLDVRHGLEPAGPFTGAFPAALLRSERWTWGVFRVAFDLGLDVRF